MSVCVICRKGKLCGSFCLQTGGGLRPPIKGSVMSSPVFAAREGCADHFVCGPQSPRSFICKNQEVSCHHQLFSKGKLCGLLCSHLIFSEYILNPGSYRKGNGFLKRSYRIFNDMVIVFQFHTSVSTSK